MIDLALRDLTEDDFEDALRLYRMLTRDPVAPSARKGDFSAILRHPGTCIIGAIYNDKVAAMITLHVLPNMTSGGRPYALVENVVCDTELRRRGIGRRLMQTGIDRAQSLGCYKIMLMTGAARGVTGFYESCGFSGHEKHGMVLRF